MINILTSAYNLHEHFAREYMKKVLHADDKIVIVPFAFREEWVPDEDGWQAAYAKGTGKYYQEIVTQFINLGIAEENIIWLNYYVDNVDIMKKRLAECQVVYFTGGLPDRAVERVLEKDLMKEIRNCRVVMGASAGALMQLENYYISPDDDYEEFAYYKGVGLVKNDFYIEVHYEDSDLQKECINKTLRERTNKVYAIGDMGIIVVENGNVEILGDVTVFENE